LSELEIAWTLWEKIKHCEMTQNNLYFRRSWIYSWTLWTEK